MRLPIFVSIRNKATRLPGKSFVEIGGLPAVDQLVERVKRSRRADGIVVCTSTHATDAVFDDVAARRGVLVFHGSEEDKLERYLDAARAHGSEFAVIVDGDDLLCDPEQIDRIFEAYIESRDSDRPYDYVVVGSLPIGATGFGVRIDALARVCELKAESDTEVWGGYFTSTGLFNAAELDAEPDLRRPDVRFTLDYREDLEIFRAVFRCAGPGPFGLREAIRCYDADPALRQLADTANKRWIPNLSASAPVRLK